MNIGSYPGQLLFIWTLITLAIMVKIGGDHIGAGNKKQAWLFYSWFIVGVIALVMAMFGLS